MDDELEVEIPDFCDMRKEENTYYDDDWEDYL